MRKTLLLALVAAPLILHGLCATQRTARAAELTPKEKANAWLKKGRGNNATAGWQKPAQMSKGEVEAKTKEWVGWEAVNATSKLNRKRMLALYERAHELGVTNEHDPAKTMYNGLRSAVAMYDCREAADLAEVESKVQTIKDALSKRAMPESANVNSTHKRVLLAYWHAATGANVEPPQSKIDTVAQNHLLGALQSGKVTAVSKFLEQLPPSKSVMVGIVEKVPIRVPAESLVKLTGEFNLSRLYPEFILSGDISPSAALQKLSVAKLKVSTYKQQQDGDTPKADKFLSTVKALMDEIRAYKESQ